MDATTVISARFPDLAGRTAIVTGTSKGIGCGIARVLGAQGMRLVLTARSDAEGRAFADSLRATGVDCLWVAADVATADGARRVFDATLERYGALDLLVNNAARPGGKPFQDLDEEWYGLTFEKNMRLVYELSYLAARYFSDARDGAPLPGVPAPAFVVPASARNSNAVPSASAPTFIVPASAGNDDTVPNSSDPTFVVPALAGNPSTSRTRPFSPSAIPRGGVIIHISSVGGLRGHRGMAGYDASKGAIDALTRAMAVDLAPKGIRVNAVAPGAIRSRPDEPSPAPLPVPGAPNTSSATSELATTAPAALASAASPSATLPSVASSPPSPPPRLGRPVAGIPIARLGLPEEIGAAVAFLASDAAAYITGQILYVDGGLTAQLTPPGIFI